MSRKILNKAFNYPLFGSSIRVPSLNNGLTQNSKISISNPKSLTRNLNYQFATSESRQNQKQSKKSDGKHKFDANSSYFEILGIEANATDQQIKTAYLQMVKKYHPDLSKQENASQKFQLIQKAYQVLSDPQQRGKHRQEQKIPNPQTYDKASQLKQKYKNFKRKDSVPDEWQFSYKLFKKHYEEVDAKEKDYKRFQGQGNQYYVHKDEMQPSKKVYVQQFSMIAGAVGIIAGAFYLLEK